MMAPECEWDWLKKASARLHAAVPASEVVGPVVTSLPVLQLGLQLMDENRPAQDGEMRIADAIRFRNGLILAFLAFIPLRVANLASLEIGRQLIREGGRWFVIIPACETKNKRPLEFEGPELLNQYLEMYLRFVRPQLLRGLVSDALWPSYRTRALVYENFRLIVSQLTRKRLGIRLTPHDLRDAAATTWAIARPAQISVGKNLLGHASSRTMQHYNRAKGIEASRALSTLIGNIRGKQGRR